MVQVCADALLHTSDCNVKPEPEQLPKLSWKPQARFASVRAVGERRPSSSQGVFFGERDEHGLVASYCVNENSSTHIICTILYAFGPH